jgi:hypothetical protein
VKLKAFAKDLALYALPVIAACALSACQSDADVASRNLSQAADSFEVSRRVVFYNGITGEYMLSIEGLCSKGNQDQPRQVTFTCKTGHGYKKHFLGLSDNITYFIEAQGLCQPAPARAAESQGRRLRQRAEDDPGAARFHRHQTRKREMTKPLKYVDTHPVALGKVGLRYPRHPIPLRPASPWRVYVRHLAKWMLVWIVAVFLAAFCVGFFHA